MPPLRVVPGEQIALAAARILRCRRSFAPRRFELPYLPVVAAAGSPGCRVPGSPVKLRGPAHKRRVEREQAAKLYRAAKAKLMRPVSGR